MSRYNKEEKEVKEVEKAMREGSSTLHKHGEDLIKEIRKPSSSAKLNSYTQRYNQFWTVHHEEV